MSDSAFENDLRATLAARTQYEVPAALYAAVRELPAGSRRRWLPTLRLAGLARTAAAVVALGVVVVLGGVAVIGYAGLPVGAGFGAGGERNFEWQSAFVTLEADSVSIDAAGHVFRPPAEAAVTSDPGTASYRSLEIEWHEQGFEQRLYLYLAADESDWWLTEIRTRDGRQPAEWVFYPAPETRIARGDSFVGDLDIAGRGANGNARLRIRNMRLTAFATGTNVAYRPGCHMAGPIEDRGDGPAARANNPSVPGVDLVAGMPAADAAGQLAAAGICHEFRYNFAASNDGQVWCSAPPGDVRWWAFGTEGQLIVFVEADPSATLAPDAPRIVDCD